MILYALIDSIKCCKRITSALITNFKKYIENTKIGSIRYQGIGNIKIHSIKCIHV